MLEAISDRGLGDFRKHLVGSPVKPNNPHCLPSSSNRVSFGGRGSPSHSISRSQWLLLCLFPAKILFSGLSLPSITDLFSITHLLSLLLHRWTQCLTNNNFHTLMLHLIGASNNIHVSTLSVSWSSMFCCCSIKSEYRIVLCFFPTSFELCTFWVVRHFAWLWISLVYFGLC